MKIFGLISVLLSILTLCKAQFGFGGFDQFTAYAGAFDSPLKSARDPRQNPGPVLFPAAPPDNGETSGVVVGASGYGFVPPNSRPQKSLNF